MRVTFSPMARNDLREIARYIAQDAPGRARTFTLELQQKALRLDDNPRSGATRYELGRGVRFLSHGNYNIYYRIGENVEILRILHGARQVGEDDI